MLDLPWMLKKTIQICEDFEWGPVPKIKYYFLHNVFPYVVFLLPPYCSDLFVWQFGVL